MSRRFVTLDVFTTRPHAGNPLAVVLDSDGLDSAAMQTIAREFNLSETVFIAPPANPANRAAIRIFTPGQELPFAGHPTVGTAALLALRDAAEGRAADRLVLEEKVGLVPCAVALGNARSARAIFNPAEAAGADRAADRRCRAGGSPGIGHGRSRFRGSQAERLLGWRRLHDGSGCQPRGCRKGACRRSVRERDGVGPERQRLRL